MLGCQQLMNVLLSFEEGKIIQIRKQLKEFRAEFKCEKKLPDHFVWRSVDLALCNLENMPEFSFIQLQNCYKVLYQLSVKRNYTNTMAKLTIQSDIIKSRDIYTTYELPELLK
jgi:hypothetical protein